MPKTSYDPFAEKGSGHSESPRRKCSRLTFAHDSLFPSLRAILAAPLIAGNDLRDIRPEIREILTHREVIAVDQDPTGIQGRRVRKNENLEVWSKPLHDGGRALVLLNRGTEEGQIGVTWEELGYPALLSAQVRDLWQGNDLGERKGRFSATVTPHSVVMATVKP